MNRVIELHSSCSTATPGSICRDIVLRHLENHREDVVRWTNPENLEFEVVNFSKLARRYQEKASRKNVDDTPLIDVLNGDVEGVKFVKKVPHLANTYRFHFISRQNLPFLPRRKTFAELVRLSTETSV